ncbi:putative calycin [Senna tora]|uniref:Putative calycin n=1 Tax=Senna tora TaxID=362788 RepID=A0A834T3Z7_9FABA|nr:putative calycin [Senna tora]
MHSPSLHLTKTFTPHCDHHLLGFHSTLSCTHNSFPSFSSSFPNHSSRKVLAQAQKPYRNARPKRALRIKGKKDNVWSIDNDLAKAASENEKERPNRRKKTEGRRMVKRRRSRGGRVRVSGAMLMEEPVIKPAWNTFASSVSGIWKGVGAVFSPLTAEMEPVEIGKRNENLYDCYTLSRIEAVPSTSGGPLTSGGRTSQIQRKINWVTLNPFGETLQHSEGSNIAKDGPKKIIHNVTNNVLPTYESFDFERSDVMEEDVMECEPGLVFFEDGSYSRGPIDIPLGEFDDTKYFITPTYKFEQCLVKGCHIRLRIVHTIEFIDGGSDIQIMRVAVYEEQWASPANLIDQSSDMELDVKPFSLRKRTRPSELIGSWKVFEVSATPVFGDDDDDTLGGNSTPYVYLCTENLKKRSFPESTNSFGEEEMLDMQDVTMLWLPGGVTCYVDIKKDGILCIGVGWYSEEGINLVMERDYGVDGKLKEVRWKSEVKRRWSSPPPL